MSLPASLGGLPPALVLAIAGALLALLAWLSWRRPTWLLLLALAALAIRPELLWGGPAVGYQWGLHQTLIVLALAVNALHFGVRRTVNWPIVALLAVLVLSLAFGNLHPKLTLPLMLESLALLALPFAFTQVVLEPGSRRACAFAIASGATLSLVLGIILQISDTTTVFRHGEWTGDYRLRGALGDGEPLGILAFAGFVVALHDTTRRGRPYAPYLAATNATLVILTGTRMAVLASVIFVFAFMMVSQEVRSALTQNRRALIVALVAVAAASIFYAPWMEARFFTTSGHRLQLSGRDVIWSVYYTDFLHSPYFGRGFGAPYVFTDAFPWVRKTPHNEYLHLLLAGGMLGLICFTAAVLFWYRSILHVVSPNDKAFVIALAPALLVLACTQDVLTYWTALPIYTYLVVILTRPAINPLQQPKSKEELESSSHVGDEEAAFR